MKSESCGRPQLYNVIVDLFSAAMFQFVLVILADC